MDEMHTIAAGDRVRMRKKHPCGSDEWIVYRAGGDIGLRCTGCDRRVMMPRSQFLKQVKQVLSSGQSSEERISP
jgi:hypothetical protein